MFELFTLKLPRTKQIELNKGLSQDIRVHSKNLEGQCRPRLGLNVQSLVKEPRRRPFPNLNRLTKTSSICIPNDSEGSPYFENAKGLSDPFVKEHNRPIWQPSYQPCASFIPPNFATWSFT